MRDETKGLPGITICAKSPGYEPIKKALDDFKKEPNPAWDEGNRRFTANDNDTAFYDNCSGPPNYVLTPIKK